MNRTNSECPVLLGLRGSRNLTQDDVARAIGITRAYYGMIESGRREPSLEIARRIAEYFDTTVEALFFAAERNATWQASTARIA